jgi:hypothetical protein
LVVAGYVDGYVVAPYMRSRRRPKQTVQPARSVRISEANVSQKPAQRQRSTWSTEREGRLTGAGVRVRVDLRELVDLVLEERVERDVDRERDERDHRGEEGQQGRDELDGDVRAQRREQREESHAGSWAAVQYEVTGGEGRDRPTGCTARPRVQDGPMITFVPAFGDPMATMYALLDDEHVRSPLSAEYEQ